MCCIVHYCMQHQHTYVLSQYRLRLMKKRKTIMVSIIEINRTILMCEWTIPLLVSLDISTRVTSKLTTGFTVHVADNGYVMWMICKSEGWSNKVINLCVIYQAQPMIYMSDLNKGWHGAVSQILLSVTDMLAQKISSHNY